MARRTTNMRDNLNTVYAILNSWLRNRVKYTTSFIRIAKKTVLTHSSHKVIHIPAAYCICSSDRVRSLSIDNKSVMTPMGITKIGRLKVISLSSGSYGAYRGGNYFVCFMFYGYSAFASKFADKLVFILLCDFV